MLGDQDLSLEKLVFQGPCDANNDRSAKLALDDIGGHAMQRLATVPGALDLHGFLQGRVCDEIALAFAVLVAHGRFLLLLLTKGRMRGAIAFDKEVAPYFFDGGLRWGLQRFHRGGRHGRRRWRWRRRHCREWCRRRRDRRERDGGHDLGLCWKQGRRRWECWGRRRFRWGR